MIDNLRFRTINSAARSDARHPLLGRLSYTVRKGPVYDVTTGLEVTREQLLADPFHYPGTPTYVPSTVLLWTFFEEADIDLSWSGLSGAVPTAQPGYVWQDDGGEDGLVRSPDEDYDRVSVYFPGTNRVSPDFSPPDETYPQPSVWCLGEPRIATPDSGDDQDQLRVVISGAHEATLGLSSSVPADVETLTAVTTIFISEESEDPYELTYFVRTGAETKELILRVGGTPVYYADHNVWAAPVTATGFVYTITRQVEINRNDLFYTVYDNFEHPEWAIELDEIIEDLEADDDVTTQRAKPVGKSRFSSLAPSALPDGESWSPTEIDMTATVTKQIKRFLDFERP